MTTHKRVINFKVSRCGIMYMDSGTLGWHPLLESWINSLPEILKEHSELITQLFERFFPTLFSMRRRRMLNVSTLT